MRDLLTEICVEAGRLLLENFHLRSGLALREKRDAGWVTEADERSEELILESLGRATPDAGVVAEESGARQGSGELTWYMDPLDGTTNFTRAWTTSRYPSPARLEGNCATPRCTSPLPASCSTRSGAAERGWATTNDYR